MKRFIEGEDRGQSTLFPERLDDWVGEDNAVGVIDVFVEELDLGGLGFGRVAPQATGRPGYHPSVLLKLYIYGYLNRVQSSRRLEREAGRNVEVMWLTGRLVPDHKTIADFRKDNGPAIRKVCARFIALCRRLDLLADACVAIDGAKFKAVNTRDKNFTRFKCSRASPSVPQHDTPGSTKCLDRRPRSHQRGHRPRPTLLHGQADEGCWRPMSLPILCRGGRTATRGPSSSLKFG